MKNLDLTFQLFAVMMVTSTKGTHIFNIERRVPFTVNTICRHLVRCMIADRILGADFLYKFQVTVNFKVQCMYTRDENGSRRHQFVTKEMSKAELKEEAPIRGIRNSTTDGDERKSS